MVDEHIRHGVQDPLGVGDSVLYGARLAPYATESNPVAKATLRDLVTRLCTLDPGVDTAGFTAGVLRNGVAAVWERGWQPRDLVHVAGKSPRPARLAELATLVVADEAQHTDAPNRADLAWVVQLESLDALTAPATPIVHQWGKGVPRPTAEIWQEALALLGLVLDLPPLEILGPRPSTWEPAAGPAPAAGTRPVSMPHPDTVEPKVLTRIRALLAKAEATEFTEEAEALTAKAQELITRHAIDSALVENGGGNHAFTCDVGARRVHIDAPYADAKASLYDAVASANGARAVWDRRFGMVTVVGVPTELDLVEVLFTSLLVQATRALSVEGGQAGTHRHSRSRSFRRGFLTAFATRIRQRLAQAGANAMEEAGAVHQTTLVPLMRQREEAVGAAFEEMFPRVSRPRATRVDAAGWRAGVRAADRADMTLRG